MSTFLQFGQAMLRRAAQVEKAGDVAVKTVALAVTSAVVRGTPVDTGEARSNWIVTLGNPSFSVRPPFLAYPRSRPADPRKFDETANAEAAIRAGVAVISGTKTGQTIYIQNNVRHIRRLNDGWSRQSPALFVQSAVKAGIRSLDGLRIFT
jgi:hypothetical protein